MKIHPSSLDALRNAKESAADRAQAKPAQGSPAPSASGGDRVDLSALSTQIAALESSLVGEPGFDRARVEEIKQAIVEGRLTINSEVVADRMVQSALALLNRPMQ